MYILITAASTAKAYQLKNQIGALHTLLGDFADLPEIMLKTGKMIILPNPQKETYPHEMLALCLDYNVDTVYLLHEEEMNVLAPARQLFDEYGITLKAAHD